MEWKIFLLGTNPGQECLTKGKFQFQNNNINLNVCDYVEIDGGGRIKDSRHNMLNRLSILTKDAMDAFIKLQQYTPLP